MIILRPYETKVLMPVSRSEWREPSQSVPLDQMGNPTTQVRFRARGKTHDGVVKWALWFDDRNQFDAFIHAYVASQIGGAPFDHRIIELPNRDVWGNFNPELPLEFATVTFLTTTGSAQTYSRPSDWNNGNNKIETLGSGASGGASHKNASTSVAAVATGGGGGAYNFVNNATVNVSSVTYIIGSPGAAVFAPSGSFSAGNAGGDACFGNSVISGSTVASKGGPAGNANRSTSATPLSGSGTAAAASGVGSGFDGGGSGTADQATANTQSASGGGGAAGGTGAGNTSANAAVNAQTSGGSADGGSGGAGGASAGSGVNASPGGNGTEWDASHGSGGGGGASRDTSGGSNGGNGGNYGGGGGGESRNGGSTANVSGAGIQGIIVVTYTPVTLSMWGTLPMMGL